MDFYFFATKTKLIGRGILLLEVGKMNEQDFRVEI